MVKLANLLEEYTDEQRRKYINKLDQVINNFTNNAPLDNKADPYINAALELFPSLRYTGKLYRLVVFGVEDFLKFKSNTDVLHHIKNYKTKYYQSFAKSLEGVEEFEAMILSVDLEDFYPAVRVYVEQVGSGLDIETYYKTKESLVEYLGPGGLGDAARVGEIIAPINKNTMQIGMYVLDEPLEYNRFHKYNPSDFNRLKKEAEDSLNTYNTYDNLSNDEEALDNFLSTHLYTDTPKTRKGFKAPPEGNRFFTSKSIHKKSKYKKYNPAVD